MSENVQAEAAPAIDGAAPCESPPPGDDGPDPRAKLLQLAGELMRSHNRRLVIEYLRLRRAIA
jgi:hypothetical protein